MALVKKAVREKVKVKVLLMSPSGGGKTYSALRLVNGMGGRTLFIDTEARRGLYYADEFVDGNGDAIYDYIELKEVFPQDEEYNEYKQLLPRINEPFAPENYIALIRYAVREKYDNLIIDSLTHEWNGKGGILDSKNKMNNYKNDYQKWAVLTPRHDEFIYEILHSPINVIATVRGKDEYVLEENEKGKSVPKKIGLGAIQRDGMEYEYTVTFMLDQETHVATPQKDNTHLFEGRYEMLSEQSGKNLIEWANSGSVISKKIKEYEAKVDNETNVQQEQDANVEYANNLKLLIGNIDVKVNAMVKEGKTDDALGIVLKHHPENKNYKKIRDIRVLEAILEELNKENV